MLAPDLRRALAYVRLDERPRRVRVMEIAQLVAARAADDESAARWKSRNADVR